MGDEAFMAVATQSFKAADAIFKHEKPGDLTFNPNADMTTLTSAQVSQALQYYTGLHAFAVCETAKTDAQMTATDFRLRVLRKSLLAELASTKRKKYDIDAEIETDAEYSRLLENKAHLTVQRLALEATMKGVEEKAACLSRELTRREGESRLAGRH